MTLEPVPAPDAVVLVGRTFACIECGTVVEVFEFPRPHLNPATFVCGQCCTDPEPGPAKEQP